MDLNYVRDRWYYRGYDYFETPCTFYTYAAHRLLDYKNLDDMSVVVSQTPESPEMLELSSASPRSTSESLEPLSASPNFAPMPLAAVTATTPSSTLSYRRTQSRTVSALRTATAFCDGPSIPQLSKRQKQTITSNVQFVAAVTSSDKSPGAGKYSSATQCRSTLRRTPWHLLSCSSTTRTRCMFAIAPTMHCVLSDDVKRG